MASKDMSTLQSVYGTELKGAPVKSNHPIRSKYLAAVLAILAGVIGAHYFYLRNIVRGVIQIVITAVFVAVAMFAGMKWLILIPFAFCVIRGIIYLFTPDSRFTKGNHVRTV